MICKCPRCDGALEYNPSSDRMDCPYCGSNFDTAEVMEAQRTQDNVVRMQSPARSEFPVGGNAYGDMQPQAASGTTAVSGAENTMECNIYTCTACGAELAVNGVEASTFCAYCGQPTIVFSRVSHELMPKYILPFRIQKDQAVSGIREKLNKGFFVPNEIKNFEVEKVRGIYIPYFLFDVYYYDWQRLRGTVGSGKHKKTKYFIREAECDFKRLTCDASKQLNDESSQRLEPYDLRMLRPFEAGYLSGFYADKYDMTDQELTGVAVGRCKELFDKEMIDSVRANSVRIVQNNPRYEVKSAEYALLPAWFMTFRYKNEPFTMLVNGQTGKVVGAVPFNKAKLVSLFIIIAIIGSIIFSVLGLFFFHEDMEGDAIGLVIGVAVVLYGSGLKSFRSVMKNIELTKARRTARFVRERQDDN